MKFKFEGYFCFLFNLKNENPNLLKQISYETNYHFPIRNNNKQVQNNHVDLMIRYQIFVNKNAPVRAQQNKR